MIVGDEAAVAGLRRRDSRIVSDLVVAWTPAMSRLARTHVATAAAAEDVVQDAWEVVLAGVDRFEGRGSLRGYVMGVVVHIARRSGERERRALPFSSAWRRDRDDDRAAAVDPDRFDRRGYWLVPPGSWSAEPGQLLEAAELRGQVERAIGRLPVRQRAVLVAGDVLGLDPVEIADMYGVSEGNQRVLLHRARAKVRGAVEAYREGTVPVPEDLTPPARPGRPAAPGGAVVCRQLIELVDDYLDARLDAALRLRVEEHLSACDHCGEYVRQVRLVLHVTACLVDDLPAEVIQRLLSALLGDATGAAEPPRRPHPAGGGRSAPD